MNIKANNFFLKNPTSNTANNKASKKYLKSQLQLQILIRAVRSKLQKRGRHDDQINENKRSRVEDINL